MLVTTRASQVRLRTEKVLLIRKKTFTLYKNSFYPKNRLFIYEKVVKLFITLILKLNFYYGPTILGLGPNPKNSRI